MKKTRIEIEVMLPDNADIEERVTAFQNVLSEDWEGAEVLSASLTHSALPELP